MNNNLIITHKDGRTWNEGQLESLLRDEGISESLLQGEHQFLRYNGADSKFGKYGWYIYYCGSFIFPLDPSLYTVSPVGMIAVDKVREMLSEIGKRWDGTLEYQYNVNGVIQSIASKYLGGEN